MLCRYLTRKGYQIVFLREPGGTAISEKIRKILLDEKNKSMAGECEMLLYMAARAQVVNQVIRPALAQGKIVISDRFLDSTLAYQGYGLGIGLDIIHAIGAFATRSLQANLTFFMDLPVKDGLRHRRNTTDRIEKRSLSYHRRVRNGYVSLAAASPERIKVIRVEPQKAMTQANIRKHVDALLRKRGSP
jgi:dTMP kinase